MLYFVLAAGALLLALVFQLASMLRLTIPLLYALLLPVIFPDWYHAHQGLGDGIFFVLLGFVALSWAVTLVRRIRG